MIRRALGLIALGATVLVVACSSDDEAAAKYPNQNSFCDAKAKAECDIVSPLCGATAEGCHQKRLDACNVLAGGAIAQGRTYTSGNAENCINQTKALYNDRVIDPKKEAVATEACQKVFSGVKKKNEACADLYSCSGSLICDVDKGVCADKATKKLTDQCNNAGDICDTGLYCKVTTGTLKTCVNDVAVGGVCGDKDPCATGTICAGGTCQAKKASGIECTKSDECATALCSNGKCFARQYASENGTCVDFGGS